MPIDEEGDPTRDGARATAATSACSSPAARRRGFCDHADDVVGAGRPPCRFCGLPMDPDGHTCPRMN